MDRPWGFALVAVWALLAGLPASAQKGPLHDAQFVEKALQGGMAEVRLGTLAVEKASTAEVRDFARQMVGDHIQAHERLGNIGREEGYKLPEQMSKEAQEAHDNLVKLSGREFDQAYMAFMVKDHEDTIKLFAQEQQSGKNDRLKAFATEVLPTLNEHYGQARTLHSQLSQDK